MWGPSYWCQNMEAATQCNVSSLAPAAQACRVGRLPGWVTSAEWGACSAVGALPGPCAQRIKQACSWPHIKAGGLTAFLPWRSEGLGVFCSVFCFCFVVFLPLVPF